ncbi:hypothetical protein D3C87_1836250 [compost metagenome]
MPTRSARSALAWRAYSLRTLAEWVSIRMLSPVSGSSRRTRPTSGKENSRWSLSTTGITSWRMAASRRGFSKDRSKKSESKKTTLRCLTTCIRKSIATL